MDILNEKKAVVMLELNSVDLISIEKDEGESSTSLVLIYEQDQLPEPVRFKRILSRISHNMRHYPRFRFRVKSSLFPYGTPNWVEETNFDIEYHIRHVALPKPGDWRQFSILVARLQSRPLATNRSLWDIYVIEGLDNMSGIAKGSFAIVCKLHKALSRDVSVKQLLKDFHDGGHFDIRFKKRPRKAPKDGFTMSLFKNVVRQYISIPLSVSTRFSRVVHTSVIREISPYLRAIFARSEFVYSRFNTNISNYRSWTSQDFLSADIDLITAAAQESVRNDVMVAIISGALKLYLRDKDELPLGEGDEWTVLVKNNLLGEWADRKQIASDYLSATININSDSPDACLTSIVSQRQGGVRVSSASEPGLLVSTPGVKTVLSALDIDNWKRHFGNLVNTSINGMDLPRQPLTLLGAKLVSISAVASIYDGMGLMHTVTEYDGRIVVSVTSCREMLPDPEFYNQCLRDSCTALMASVLKDNDVKNAA